MTSLSKMAVLSTLCALPLSASDQHGPPCTGPNDTRSGIIMEHSAQQNTDFTVFISNSTGAVIATIPLLGMNVAGDGSVAQQPVNMPGMPGNVNVPGGCDAWNQTGLPNPGNGNGGAGPGVPVGGSGPSGTGPAPSTPTSSLQIESYGLVNGVWMMYSPFTEVDLSIQTGDVLMIPDLYATDSNGNLINEELYGLVNVDTYLPGTTCTLSICEVPYTLGETFNIVNGAVAGLPGMLFSTSPWVFSSTTGFTDPGGNYTGSAEVISEHGLESIPEPSAAVLLGTGLLAMALVMRKRSAR
jgi:hypothetical protein